MTETRNANVDRAEIARFEALADRWWDTEGDFKPLHDINPARLEFIEQRAGLAGRRVLDIGCGGGILAESMAARGARVTAIDMAEAPLAVARIHVRESGLDVEYLKSTAEEHADARPGAYDTVTCLEMLEHVPDPGQVIAACHRLVKPGGHVFFSTINRNPKAWVMAIFGAEYVLRLLPRGTHEYAKLIRPSELADWIRAAGLELTGFTGMHYNPFTRDCTLGGNVHVNYLAHARKREAG
ncbi:MAG TPA: bifunctional 2-polyprenyl-6-hydroxyphenol methylase/3-demethylubiquinol 3-O-methyltransferase UbiG [Gammaproteobacteria bacterium]|nr:bifunctional 2-polyprenyl-6-hydroxyphenol methylase/3-demethylubiquinol 3-O-methyltransferase UbiG [Gammaproteobacteria bacterium]HRP86623.1 bifunctional 2-polyprenyl-6-hydroxyphenol methylase/3-demethylubiquinol 3-O-methyltransferase UbiG [Gammaproteobacteria bacterium]